MFDTPYKWTKQMGIIAGTGYFKDSPSKVGASIKLSAKYSEKWLTDAIIESKKRESQDTIRREIVFSVCFVESYLVEWVCSLVELDEVASYFPLREGEGTIDRWQSVTSKLQKGQIIATEPDFSQSDVWPEFRKLVKFRDGLVYAVACLSGIMEQTNKGASALSPDDLARVVPGWACGVGITFIKELHQASSTSPLPWIDKY